jgi:hypothetical protein
MGVQEEEHLLEVVVLQEELEVVMNHQSVLHKEMMEGIQQQQVHQHQVLKEQEVQAVAPEE